MYLEDTIKIQNIKKSYNKFIALNNISFSVKKGEIFALLGPNGSGKSTTLKIISGLIPYDSGSCYVFNKEIKSNKKYVQKRIGLVSQEYAIYDDLKVQENLEFIGKLYGLSGVYLKNRVAEAVALVGLEKYISLYPCTFSGGIKRRLNIACALVHNPSLLIMDEPTASLDPISREFILKSIKDIASLGTTIIYTSHYLEEIETLCSRASIIDKGSIVASGNTNEIKKLFTFKNTITLYLNGVLRKHRLEIENIKALTIIPYTVAIESLELSNGNYNYILSINCDNISIVLERIIPFLKDRKIYIKNIDIKKNTLEEVYMKLINNNI